MHIPTEEHLCDAAYILCKILAIHEGNCSRSQGNRFTMVPQFLCGWLKVQTKDMHGMIKYLCLRYNILLEFGQDKYCYKGANYINQTSSVSINCLTVCLVSHEECYKYLGGEEIILQYDL